MTYLEKLDKTLLSIQQEVVPIIEKLAIPSRILGAIAALLFISYRIWRDWSENQPIELFPLLRPFVLLLCISFFPFVPTVINGILDPISNGTKTLFSEQHKTNEKIDENMFKYQRQYGINQINNLITTTDLKDFNLFTFGSKIGKMIAEAFHYSVTKLFFDFVQELIDFITKVMLFGIPIARTSFLMVLSVMGPIVFAISIFPGLESSLSSWITRYISVSLWLPILYIISYLIAKINASMFDQWAHSMNNDETVIRNDLYIFLVFKAIALFGYFKVPTISSWIIQSTGAAGYGKMIGSMTGSGVVRAAKAVKTKGLSEAVKFGKTITGISKKG